MNLNIFDQANYPPLFLLCFLPFSFLAGPVAYTMWMLLQYLSLAAILYLIVGKDNTLDRSIRASFCSLAVLFFPLYDNFYYAQVQLMMLLGFLVLHRLLVRRADRLAGIVLSILVSLKLYPLVLGGYLLTRRRWRAVTWTVLGLAIEIVFTWYVYASLLTKKLSTSSELVNSSMLNHRRLDISAMLSAVRVIVRQKGGFLSLSDQIARLMRWVDRDVSEKAITYGILFGLGLVLFVTVYVTIESSEHWKNDIAAFSLWVVLTPLITHAYQDYAVLLLLLLFAIIAESAMRGETFADVATWLILVAYILSNATPIVFGVIRQPVMAAFKEVLTIGFMANCFYALSIGKDGLLADSETTGQSIQ